MPFPLSFLVRSTAVGLLAVSAAVQAHAGQPGKLAPDAERGERLYLENCWHCHGKRGLGDGPLAEAGPVTAPPLAGRVPDERDPWVTIIHRGKESMPAFGPVFDRHDARRVLIWLDSLDPETGDGPSIEDGPEPADAERRPDKAKPGSDGARDEGAEEGSPVERSPKPRGPGKPADPDQPADPDKASAGDAPPPPTQAGPGE